MSFKIAITGKGGVGKTTIAGLFTHCLIRNGLSPVLAVDADPNTCLDSILGVHVEKTIGGIREEAREIAKGGMAGGRSKQELLEFKISESLVEGDDFDLIAMGRPEGPGCYCYANNVLKEVLKKISESYPYIIIDNEAGLENLSRRIIQKVDLLVMVCDSSKRGIDTVYRLFSLAREMGIEFDKSAVILNRTHGSSLHESFLSIKKNTGVDFFINIDDNRELCELNEQGRDIMTISPDNSALKQVDDLLKVLELVNTGEKKEQIYGRN